MVQQSNEQTAWLAKLGLPESSLLRNSSFFRVWLASAVAVLGESVSHLALPLTAVQLLHASAAQMGLLFAAGTLPFALFSLPAGVWLDRTTKKTVIVLFQILGGLALATVPLSYYLGVLDMRVLYAANFLVGSCYCVGGSAAQIFLTSLVGRERLVEANSLQASASSVAALAGPVLAGVLVATLGAPLAVSVDALAFVGSAVLIASVRSREAIPVPDARSVWLDLFSGLRFIWQQPILRMFAVMAAMFIILFDGFMALYVLHATRDLTLTASQVAWVNTLGAIGALFGALLVHRANRVIGQGYALVAGLISAGAGFLLYAMVPAGAWAVWLAGCAMLLVEGGMTAYTVNYLAMRQAVTPDAMLGRMITTMRCISVSGAPLGSLLVGQAAGSVGLVPVIISLGVATLLVALWVILRVVDQLHIPVLQGGQSRN